MFAAKRVTAVISMSAEKPSVPHACDENCSYARICELTRSRHPRLSSSSESSITRVLQSHRTLKNAGRTREPMVNAVAAKKPTVSAWRDAPAKPRPAMVPRIAATIDHE